MPAGADPGSTVAASEFGALPPNAPIRRRLEAKPAAAAAAWAGAPVKSVQRRSARTHRVTREPDRGRHAGPARTLLSSEMSRALAATLFSAVAACGFRSPDPADGFDAGIDGSG